MARLSYGTRSSCLTVLWCLVPCLLLLHLYSFTSPRVVSRGSTRSHQSPLKKLELVEGLQIPSTLFHRPSLEISSLTDEFLNTTSRLNKFFFPGKKTAIDPQKHSVNTSLYFRPGRIWLDTDGNPIQAHGGGIMYDEKSRMYYWYGEYKDGPTYHFGEKRTARVDVIGVGCYSSNDLWRWKFEGIVLSADEKNKFHDLHKSNVLERPKVIYNIDTGKYVMWMHIDNGTYTKASIGVAISYSPRGPFSYLYSKRPHGFESRDMTIFKDGDERAYIIYSSVHNKELHIGQLNGDYLNVTEEMSKVLVGQYREAPAVFKHREKYYMVTSGCSGWAPNEALAHVAESIKGPWVTLGNPSVGANTIFRAATFFAQSTFVLPMPGSPSGSFIFMADRWNPADLKDSRYVWLPLTVRDAAEQQALALPLQPRVSIYWHDSWRLSNSN
ncbi:glycosidase [Lithospermum erythrorhizon]|uniref:Glycosidase n=1 Tax=Lithospermum erythrorhizon TaxID=34254 RepID=A0AAV3P8Q9_LITER